jgi:hypothetical protein
MTSRDDGRQNEREDTDGDGQGRQTRDDGDDREGWTPDAEKPQRKEDVTTAEPEGSVPEGGTGEADFDPPLEAHEYPVTTDELRRAYGEYRVDTDAGPKPLKELLEPADGETFGSAEAVRRRLEKLADR